MRSFIFVLLMCLPTLGFPATSDPSLHCFSTLASEPSIQLLRGKISFGSAESQTASMLTNTQLPTPAERISVSRWINMYNTCDSQADLWRRANFFPSYVKMYNQFVSDLTVLATEFSKGGMSYGNFARLRAQQETQFNSDAENLIARFKNAQLNAYGMAQQAQDNQVRVQQQQQQQRANATLQNQQMMLNQQQMYLNRQQMLNNQRQATKGTMGTQTNCYAIGNLIHCNSN